MLKLYANMTSFYIKDLSVWGIWYWWGILGPLKGGCCVYFSFETCPGPSPIFQLGYLLNFWVVRVIICSQFKPLIRQVICKKIFPYCGLFFHFSESVLWSTEAFSSDKTAMCSFSCSLSSCLLSTAYARHCARCWESSHAIFCVTSHLVFWLSLFYSWCAVSLGKILLFALCAIEGQYADPSQMEIFLVIVIITHSLMS
jgi:hypothetical protein